MNIISKASSQRHDVKVWLEIIGTLNYWGRYARCFTDVLSKDSLSTHLTDCISKNKLGKKSGSISFSRAIMKDRSRWLVYVLETKDCQRYCILTIPATLKACHPQMRWEEVIRKGFIGNCNFMGGGKKYTLNRLR